MGIRSRIKQWLPPEPMARLKPWIGDGIRFLGDFPDWEAARKRSTGYDSAVILERVSEAMRQVAGGEAKYERDSVLFDEPQISYPVLSGLLAAAVKSEGHLKVLDFGGSLGSAYFQYRNLLSPVRSLTWAVVEQEHFVDHGKQHFQTADLRFHHTIAECVAEVSPNVVLLSSVLQYLPDPGPILEELVSAGAAYMIIDRTPFVDGESDRVTIQHVPSSIYKASYPCRLFARGRFLDGLRHNYVVVASFDSLEGMAFAGVIPFGFGGMILRRSC
jgi:putative methyltransferase (TIGR04325 family)